MTDEEASRLRALQTQLREDLREGLERIDDHPIGHVVVEFARAKFQQRSLTPQEIASLLLGATLHQK